MNDFVSLRGHIFVRGAVRLRSRTLVRNSLCDSGKHLCEGNHPRKGRSRTLLRNGVCVPRKERWGGAGGGGDGGGGGGDGGGATAAAPRPLVCAVRLRSRTPVRNK